MEPPLRKSASPPGARPLTGFRTCSQVVQGPRRYQWETFKATYAEIELLEKRFNEVVVFSDTEIQSFLQKCQHILVGKFLGRDLLVEFVE